MKKLSKEEPIYPHRKKKPKKKKLHLGSPNGFPGLLIRKKSSVIRLIEKN